MNWEPFKGYLSLFGLQYQNITRLIKNRNLFLTDLEAGESKIKVLVMYHESLLPRLFYLQPYIAEEMR